MKLLQVSNIKVDITEDEKTAFKKALKKAGLSKDKVSSWKIIKLSIDARKKAEIHKIYVIGLYVKEYNFFTIAIFWKDTPTFAQSNSHIKVYHQLFLKIFTYLCQAI